MILPVGGLAAIPVEFWSLFVAPVLVLALMDCVRNGDIIIIEEES